MFLKNTNNFPVTVSYGTYSLSLTAGMEMNVNEMIPSTLPEGVIVLEKTDKELITEPDTTGKMSEVESVDNSKLLLG